MFLIKRKDGGVSIMSLYDGKTDPHAEIAKWHETLQAQVESVEPITPDRIPQDRTFRDAWMHCPVNGCRIDMPRARSIHKDRLRAIRASKLAALDVAALRAIESGDTKALADIARQKQVLRDVTADPAIEAATTPEALKAVIPEALR